MNIKRIHPDLIIPTKSRDDSAGFDLYMPTPGMVVGDLTKLVDLGFAAAIPQGYVGLILPRSGVGVRNGVELANTCGVIDSDYRGEWKAAIRTKSGTRFTWEAGDRVLQLIIVPVATHIALTEVEELDETVRGAGGFGSSGK